MTKSPRPAFPLRICILCDQILEVGTAWERGYSLARSGVRIHVITSTGISVFRNLVKLLDLNADSKYIIKIGQKLHCHVYIQAHSADIQLVSGIAVLYPQFGDAVTSIQSTCSVQHTGSVERKGHHAKIK